MIVVATSGNSELPIMIAYGATVKAAAKLAEKHFKSVYYKIKEVVEK